MGQRGEVINSFRGMREEVGDRKVFINALMLDLGFQR